MASNEDKKRWKKEAQQLKNDLDSTKVVEKREVAIKFPKRSRRFQLNPNLNHQQKTLTIVCAVNLVSKGIKTMMAFIRLSIYATF